MKIRYIEPLSRAIDRATEICFRPFDLGKWFVLGFACWLARLTQGGGGGGGSFPMPPIGDREAEGAALAGPLDVLRDLSGEQALATGAIVAIVGCVALVVLVLVPLLMWLSSRGQFVFLDGVVLNRAAIKEPWGEYRKEGNSLFLWQLGFVLVVLVVIAMALTPLILFVVRHGDDLPSIPTGLLLICPVVLVAIAAAYVDLFLRSFVVPIMYKERLKTTEAWRRFGPYLKEHLGSFILYGLWLVALMIAVAFGVVILIVFTCCIAGILLIIPYIGTVLLLPVYVALRALSLEYLAQFSDDFRLFPEPGPGSEPLAAAAGGGTLPPPAPELPPSTFEPEV